MNNEQNLAAEARTTALSIRFKITAAIISGILVLILIFLVPLIYHGVRAAAGLTGSWSTAQGLVAEIENRNWPAAAASAQAIAAKLDGVDYHLGRLGPVSYLPKLKHDWRAARQLVAVARSLASGYGETFELFARTARAGETLDLFTLLSNPAALELISQDREQLAKIETEITGAKALFAEINTADFTGFFAGRLLPAHGLLGQLVESSDLVLPAIGQLAELLGYNTEKHYLLIFQNNMELRPSGGFIGSYGIVTIRDGKIANLFIDDVYNLDKLIEGKLQRLAPPPMLTYNNQRYWYLRDANWFANWPDSAKNIAEFFAEERRLAGLSPQPIDGVIAVTPDFIANLLAVAGPIESHGLTFSHENFAWDLEMFVEFDFADYGIPFERRKAIIGEIANQLVGRIESLAAEKPLELWLAFKKNIDEKHILVYVFDEQAQRYFSERNWAGEVRPAAGDYLMVVDSNFASLKTDAVMERSIKRTLRREGADDLIARLEMTYRHRGEFVTDLVTRYRTYARVYVPADSWFERAIIRDKNGETLLKIDQDLAYGREYGKSYAAYFVVIEPGETKTVILEYRLPDYIKEQYRAGQYHLLVQKQPGTIGHNLEIDLSLDKAISAYQSPSLPAYFKGQTIGWQDNLAIDREYLIKF